MSEHRARLRMTPQFLAERLGLPEGIRVVGVDWDLDFPSSVPCLVVIIADTHQPSRLPPNKDGEAPPMIEPVITKQPQFVWDLTRIVTR